MIYLLLSNLLVATLTIHRRGPIEGCLSLMTRKWQSSNVRTTVLEEATCMQGWNLELSAIVAIRSRPLMPQRL
ncbi:unnamed protein product [Coregonus sp. 'balchen']|nr:unnamed protein product [Coregonus sp. 'balchen']